MVKTVDLTKVDISPKAMVWMCIAFSLVLLAYGIGQWGSGKLKDVIKAGASGVAQETEDF